MTWASLIRRTPNMVRAGTLRAGANAEAFATKAAISKAHYEWDGTPGKTFDEVFTPKAMEKLGFQGDPIVYKRKDGSVRFSLLNQGTPSPLQHAGPEMPAKEVGLIFGGHALKPGSLEKCLALLSARGLQPHYNTDIATGEWNGLSATAEVVADDVAKMLHNGVRTFFSVTGEGYSADISDALALSLKKYQVSTKGSRLYGYFSDRTGMQWNGPVVSCSPLDKLSDPETAAPLVEPQLKALFSQHNVVCGAFSPLSIAAQKKPISGKFRFGNIEVATLEKSKSSPHGMLADAKRKGAVAFIGELCPVQKHDDIRFLLAVLYEANKYGLALGISGISWDKAISIPEQEQVMRRFAHAANIMNVPVFLATPDLVSHGINNAPVDAFGISSLVPVGDKFYMLSGPYAEKGFDHATLKEQGVLMPDIRKVYAASVRAANEDGERSRL